MKINEVNSNIGASYMRLDNIKLEECHIQGNLRGIIFMKNYDS